MFLFHPIRQIKSLDPPETSGSEHAPQLGDGGPALDHVTTRVSPAILLLRPECQLPITGQASAQDRSDLLETPPAFVEMLRDLGLRHQGSLPALHSGQIEELQLAELVVDVALVVVALVTVVEVGIAGQPELTDVRVDEAGFDARDGHCEDCSQEGEVEIAAHLVRLVFFAVFSLELFLVLVSASILIVSKARSCYIMLFGTFDNKHIRTYRFDTELS